MNFRALRGDFGRFGAYEKNKGLMVTFVVRNERDVKVIFFMKNEEKPAAEVKLDRTYSIGRVYSAYFPDVEPSKVKYLLHDSQGTFIDPYAPVLTGREKWMDESRYDIGFAAYGAAGSQDITDQISDSPEIASEDLIMYKLNVRSFTMNSTVSRSHQGNYKGVVSRIPYLKDLGINCILAMPLYEFEEQRFRYHLERTASETDQKVYEMPYGTNLWGYGPGNFFAPKASYFGKDPEQGFAKFVSALHDNGMKLIMEVSYIKGTDILLFMDVLRFWSIRFKVDGFRIIGMDVPIREISEDPFLSDELIFCDNVLEDVLSNETNKHIFVYSDSFMFTLRRLTNHIDGSVAELANQMKRQNSHYGFVNFAANTFGFTLLDSFSYGEKHNEANGEDNRDGSNYNAAFNHGTEGETRNKGIIRSRLTAVRTSLAVVFTAQAIPAISAGDEALNSAAGNNNPYCQDNAVGWVLFSKRKDAREITSFVKNIITFRKNHTCLSQADPMKESDYKNAGIPDISYHLAEPWIMGIGAEKLKLGILYSGYYGKNEDEDDVMVCLNFYYGDESFALPHLVGERKWHFVTNTSKTEFVQEGRLLDDQDKITVPGGSVTILIGKDHVI